MQVTVFQQGAGFNPVESSLLAAVLGSLKGPVCSLVAVKAVTSPDDSVAQSEVRTFGYVLLDGKQNVPDMPTLDLAKVPDHVIGSCKKGFNAILEKLTFEDPTSPEGDIENYKRFLTLDWINFIESCDGGDLQKGISQDLCKELSKISKRSADAVSGVDSISSTETPSGNEITTTTPPRVDQGGIDEVDFTTTEETVSTSTNSLSNSSPFLDLTTLSNSEFDNQVEEETTTLEYSTTESQTTQSGGVRDEKDDDKEGDTVPNNTVVQDLNPPEGVDEINNHDGQEGSGVDDDDGLKLLGESVTEFEDVVFNSSAVEVRVVRSTDASTEVSHPQVEVESTEQPFTSANDEDDRMAEINTWKDWIFHQLRDVNATNDTGVFPLSNVEAELFWVFMGSLNETLFNSSDTMDLSTVLSVRRLLLHVQGLKHRQWILGLVFIISTAIMCCASLMLIARNSHSLAKFTSRRVRLAKMRRRQAMDEKRIAEEECLSGELERLILKRNASILSKREDGKSTQDFMGNGKMPESQVCSCEGKGSEWCGCVTVCVAGPGVEGGDAKVQGSASRTRESLKTREVLKDYPELRKEVERAVASKKTPSAPKFELYPKIPEVVEMERVDVPPPEYPGVEGREVPKITNPGPVMGNPLRMKIDLERLGKPSQGELKLLLRNNQ